MIADLEGLIGEMSRQASLGHQRFCVGAHAHEGGELEFEWIDWTDAFANLRDRHQQLISEARAEGAQAMWTEIDTKGLPMTDYTFGHDITGRKTP